jgi:phosphotriesterase-related protein
MATRAIQTALGPLAPEQLGRTLMHEHLVIGFPGFESDTIRPGPGRDEIFRACVDRIEELKGLGIGALVDPCPNDLGRDVELAAKVAQQTRFPIVVATGLYKEAEGAHPYWAFRATTGGGVDSIAELFEKEITEGIGSTGVRAGIIKVATGVPAITPYERTLLAAAAKASVATGAPITTHTDQGRLGDEQQRILTEAGVPPHRIVIGHSCGSDDHAYHLGIAEGGSYLGFDRFGIEMLQPDAKRVESLLRLLRAGRAAQIVVSHDTVWCWRGEPIARPEAFASLAKTWEPGHFLRRIVPRLKDGGASDDDVELLLRENPRRFFAGEPLPARKAAAG